MDMDCVTTVKSTIGKPVEFPSAIAQMVPEKKSSLREEKLVALVRA